ncbi:MAG: hypothetical protein KIS77_09130 [Saprospiraceae bacterium]|nr:hypothetical protein [Saprospiraceae bacterium]
MIPMQVEETLATPQSFRFTGQSVVTIQELPTTGPWPANLIDNKLIQCEQPVRFGFQWTVSGVLVPLLSNSNRWKVQLHFEKWGPLEFDLGANGTTYVNFVPVSGHTYNVVITLPANSIPEGVFEVVAILRLYDQRNQPIPVAGFAELGKIEFYEAA